MFDLSHRIPLCFNFKSRLKELLKSTDWPEQILTLLKLQSPCSPRMYGLLKVHKQGIPLHPIVNAIGASMFDITKYLARLLKPMVRQGAQHIKNSAMFSEFID